MREALAWSGAILFGSVAILLFVGRYWLPGFLALTPEGFSKVGVLRSTSHRSSDVNPLHGGKSRLCRSTTTAQAGDFPVPADLTSLTGQDTFLALAAIWSQTSWEDATLLELLARAGRAFFTLFRRLGCDRWRRPGQGVLRWVVEIFARVEPANDAWIAVCRRLGMAFVRMDSDEGLSAWSSARDDRRRLGRPPPPRRGDGPGLHPFSKRIAPRGDGHR
jgi:hypothetical protein